jgi:antitoxin (DNA-binding transcriptional repressor) of toxin-antitoxin stability system
VTAIPARDLRNHTAEILRRVEAGEEIEVFKDNHPVAKIIRFHVGGSGSLHQRSAANSNGWDQIPPA